MLELPVLVVCLLAELVVLVLMVGVPELSWLLTMGRGRPSFPWTPQVSAGLADWPFVWERTQHALAYWCTVPPWPEEHVLICWPVSPQEKFSVVLVDAFEPHPTAASSGALTGHEGGQTPSNGLRHPSFGGRCRKAMPRVWKEGWLADTTSWWFCTDYGQRCRGRKRHKLVSTILNSIADCKTVNTHYNPTPPLDPLFHSDVTESTALLTLSHAYSVAIRHLALPPSKPTPSCQVPIYTLSLPGHSYSDRFLSDQHHPTPPISNTPPSRHSHISWENLPDF